MQSHFLDPRISDLAQLKYPDLIRMLETIRQRARRSRLSKVPVVLANHTKDIRDFTAIETYLDVVAAASDLKTITVTDLAKGLLDGTYMIRTRNKFLRQSARQRLSA